MGYVGDAQLAAPMLSEVRLPPEEAAPLLDEVLRNIELMLQHGMIHGDLSAYNLLYWQGAITLIDFPQVTDSRANPSARVIFQRDVRRICEYFARQGVERDADALARWLWKRYAQPRPDDLAADLSRDFDDPAWS
jgi:RIO kinase 1